ncbi:hypothetical protein [Zhihengliuella halotolerans]|uniref:hypothetical protein n=1 Tax=Zhihengliuella halotolerans TaxID=370736 RepID=UPI0011AF09FC|nr:hypothetical protein [Zhihengliuella halotolerans]
MDSRTPNPESAGRRSVVKAAVWTVPTIAVAVAAPAAAASVQVTNADANYYWAGESQGMWVGLDPAASDLRVNFSTQIAFRSTADLPSPPEGVMILTLMFSSPVRLDTVPAGWSFSPSAGTDSTSFTLTSTGPLAWGHQLTANFTGTEPGPMTVTALMDTTSTATTSEPATAAASLTA